MIRCSYCWETNIVKPVLRGHLWKKENMVLQDRWSLKRGSNHMNFSMTGQEMWPFNTGDCFIEVTTWAGLTVYTCCVIYNNRSQSFRNINSSTILWKMIHVMFEIMNFGPDFSESCNVWNDEFWSWFQWIM
jgi:hypothetical protein